ncbi:hypothetical protein A2715_06115 [Candidatus Woesebacteria bacterium RIFCSPHIGHO2_01_FULL_39_32]|uniref:Transposase IS200-like domain-containing protein n=2 Tax=Candidatus Woeseibacteriota TaxID=1752722 RepID=A0A0G0PN68_9BACT|nr:MAG: hypothetical protein UT61_C0026G0006 [Candidatus Woesebacteria bacterium GW2011_GWA1_39_8]OGM05536.1 MAG: hypothetical protein A2124_00640 [Candidatus Woesebacteria bacterium GWB1_37_5]OGM25587.1 MAG: hypothetical protein A2715_06115 [Candidatus Woesebacteria bacterium RIFCSPHIGHO2_01_FULL_39_32]OGM36866.1 MAG: hypothetical protein A3F01_00590 [Candidatus Woesebacteria bacterium RIFCSPHIGHO2_12_FULL_38_11]OGM65118.1 MAG: hypothetical protein A2893_05725 [Candidatus Woesebacteria bacteri
MPLRNQVLATNEVYHVVNRGVASLPIFRSLKDYKRFLDLVNFYRFTDVKLSFSAFLDLNLGLRSGYLVKLNRESKQTLQIYAYSLMPNHFHFLVKQLEDGGIKSTFARIQNAYAKYFNLKNKRSGPLFQSRFKAKWIEKDEILLHVSRYIHLNPCTSYIVEPLELSNYIWSSYPEYLGLRKPIFANLDLILKIAGGIDNYKKFVLNQVDYQRELGKIKHLVLD